MTARALSSPAGRSGEAVVFVTAILVLHVDTKVTPKGNLTSRERERLTNLIGDAVGRREGVWHAEVVRLEIGVPDAD